MKSLVTGLRTPILCIASVATGVSVEAATIFSNFAPGSGYSTTQSNPVGNAFDGNDYAEGDTFTSATTATFSSLHIALSCFATCSSTFSVRLTRDSGGQPGTTIESFNSPAASLGVLGANNPALVFNSSLLPILLAGTPYWITISSNPTDSIGWNLNSTGDASPQALSTDGGATWFAPSGNTPGAFQIDAIPLAVVPEPSSVQMLLLAGFSGWLTVATAVKRRGQKRPISIGTIFSL